VHVAVNGELYDFERVRARLRARGHRFRGDSDSEIALHLYEDRGLDFLAHLRGEFALVLWDGRARRLIAARDRFGVKPLCYAEVGGALHIASEAKALWAAGVPAAWDGEALLAAAAHQYLLPERTLFAGVRQVAPGHVLCADDAGVRVAPYWDLDYPATSAPPADAPTCAGEVRRLLDEAVRLRLRADVPVAACLSGGLDSSAVVALAARHAPRPLDCFTLAFSGAYDERDAAAAAARHAGANLHVVRVSGRELVEALPDAVAHAEGLAINGQLPAKFLLARAVRAAGYKVVLTGEGADEGFLGYAHLARDLLAARVAAGDRAARALLAKLDADGGVQAGVMLPAGDAPAPPAIARALGNVPSFLGAKAGLGRRLGALLGDDARRALDDDAVFERLLAGFDVAGQLAGRHPVLQSAYLWTRLALAGYILRTLGDGTEMAHSVEGRVPFLDHHLFEFARTLPPSWSRGDKHVLREALRPVLPDAIRLRPKHPLLAPPLLGGPDADRVEPMIQDVLRGAALASVPIFDRARVIAWLDRLPRLGVAERAAADPALWTVLCACLLQERFRLGGPAS
jgi:asparagine synthase (glutamine-hydrolysing)